MQGWGWRTHQTYERGFGMRATLLPSSPVAAASSRAPWLPHYAASRPQVCHQRLVGALQADFGRAKNLQVATDRESRGPGFPRHPASKQSQSAANLPPPHSGSYGRRSCAPAWAIRPAWGPRRSILALCGQLVCSWTSQDPLCELCEREQRLRTMIMNLLDTPSAPASHLSAPF